MRTIAIAKTLGRFSELSSEANAMQYVWVRLGDADNYNPFDDLTDAAEYMAQFGVRHVERGLRYGVEANGFTGQNYISLFYGDRDAQPTRELPNKDIQFINRVQKKHPYLRNTPGW